jgi:hypothetical protein
MRTRKRTDTRLRCYKYHCWLKSQVDALLPVPIYNATKRQQALWNQLVTEQDRRYQAWREAHPATASEAEPAKTANPDKAFWADFDEWARQAVADSGLNWEMGPEILDRYYSACKRLRSGGGAPRTQCRLDHFSLSHRYTGGGLPVERLSGERQRRFRILFPDSAAYTDNCRQNRRERLASAWFEIDDEIIGLNVILHRAIPASAIVKRVALAGWKQSPAAHWQLSLLFSVEEPLAPEHHSPNTVGVEVGWRKINEDRLRVCVIWDGSLHEEVALPLRYYSKDLGEVSLDRKREIQTMRDRLLDQCKSHVRKCLAPLPPGFDQMRNSGLIRLLHELTDTGRSPESLEHLVRWRRDHDQLTRKILLIENRLIGRRRHIYGEFAARLVRRFGIIHTEKLNLKSLAKKPQGAAPGSNQYALEAAAERRRYAACGELLAAIRNAASRTGRIMKEIPAAHTTSTCAKCGKGFEAGVALEGRCQSGHISDQDWNAAENIYANRPGSDAEQEVATTA